jgi:hypothetical protein
VTVKKFVDKYPDFMVGMDNVDIYVETSRRSESMYVSRSFVSILQHLIYG